MNRLLYLAFCCTSLCTYAHAQGYTLCNQVIGSTGFASLSQNQRYTWTVGETVITTLPRPFIGRILTQGFHQPEFCQTVSAVDMALADLKLQVFPNPAASFLSVNWDDAHSPTLLLQVFNAHGQLVETAPDLYAGKELPCGHWPPGIYLMHLTDPATRAAAVVRIIRMNR